MTSYYIYAILPPEVNVPPELAGFHAEPLTVVRAGELSAVVAPHSGPVPEPTEEHVTAHHEVIVVLRELGPALPVRFGTIVSGPEELAEQLHEQSDALRFEMDRLDNTVEYGITVLWSSRHSASKHSSPLESNVTTGTDYMRQRFAAYQKERELRELAESISADIEEILNAHAAEVQMMVLPIKSVPVRGKFLVRADDHRRFEQAVAGIRRRYADLRFLLVGPWPPYSFVGVGTGAFPGTHAAGAPQQRAKSNTPDLLSRLIGQCLG